MSCLVRFAFVITFLLPLTGCGMTVGAPNIPTAVVPSSPTPPHSDILNPVGAPLAEWEGIPIMPQAIAGQKYLDGSYSYTISASMDEAQKFYLQEMAARGWRSIDGGFVVKGDGFVAIFEKDINVANITIRPGLGVKGGVVVILHVN
jgi:hypothetical protein